MSNSSQTHSENIPTLAPPGAGLPWIELRVARIIFGFGLRTTSRTESEDLFVHEAQSILGKLNGHSKKDLEKQILIKRLRGLEDSSRYWSVYMTLAHLNIVNRSITKIIPLLVRGEAPERAANTAEVKPSANVGEEVVQEFRDTCDKLLTVMREQKDLNTTARYSHPWFGPLNARGWHFLPGFHMSLHRRQIDAIIEKL